MDNLKRFKLFSGDFLSVTPLYSRLFRSWAYSLLLQHCLVQTAYPAVLPAGCFGRARQSNFTSGESGYCTLLRYIN